MTALRKSANLLKIETELSIVITSFNEQNNLQALYSELMKLLPSLTRLSRFSQFKFFTEIVNCHKIRWLHIYIIFY